MSLQSPKEDDGENISPEEFLKLKEHARLCHEHYSLLLEQKSASYKHIIGNALAGNVSRIIRFPPDRIDSELAEATRRALDYINKYATLLADFPEFARLEEIPSGKGAFPRIFGMFLIPIPKLSDTSDGI